jgi:arsenite methyltransferase
MTDATAIENAVRARFDALAVAPSEETRFPVGRASALRLGYRAEELDALPSAAIESFAGVGNPLSSLDLRNGRVILDVGCGAGTDSLLAARKAAPDGSVFGVDFSEEMAAKARRNAAALGLSNARFVVGRADALPVEAESFDVVLSNGVFNLCVDKPKVVAEMFRALRPGGVLRMADMILEDRVSEADLARMGAWSD